MKHQIIYYTVTVFFTLIVSVISSSNDSYNSNNNYVMVSSGQSHTCAIGLDYNVYCWGSDNSGQIGNDRVNIDSSVPVAVVGLPASSDFQSVSCGENHSCALSTAGEVYCWGDGLYGQLGVEEQIERYHPTALHVSTLSNTNIVQIATGDIHTCAVDDKGALYCWGSNTWGQIGVGRNLKFVKLPTQIGYALANEHITSVACGNHFTCTTTQSGKVFCFGSGYYGQLGNKMYYDQYYPVESSVLNDMKVATISCGSDYTCVVTEEQKAYCYGYLYGFTRTSPTLVSPLEGVVGISCGEYHVCVTTVDREAYCWGNNYFGQQGGGDDIKGISSVTPVRVGNNTSLKDIPMAYINSGYHHTCAVSTDNKFYCWGQGDSGRLGNNKIDDFSLPQSVITFGV